MKNQPPAGGAHPRIRSDHSSEIAEDYLEAILEISEAHLSCRMTDLAIRFEVSRATVNRTVNRLIRDGYVVSERYGPVMLTAEGRKIAEASRARHVVVYEFLLALGVSPETAAIDSEGIEHHVSNETLAAMKRMTSKKTGLKG